MKKPIRNTRRTLKEARRKRLTLEFRIINELKPYDQRAFYNYNRSVGQEKNNINETRTTFSNSVKSIYQAIQELLVEEETGVFLEEYGYFSTMIIAELKNDRKNSKKIKRRDNTEVYSLQLFTDIGNKSAIKGMTMEGSFSRETRGMLHRAIYAGLRPKLYYTTLFSMFNKRRLRL